MKSTSLKLVDAPAGSAMISPLKPKLHVNVGGKSRAGLRLENQDAFAVRHPKNHHAIVCKGITACIADGVSCSDNGQQASQLSVTQFITDYYATPDTWSVKQSASRVLRSLNDWLYHHSQLAYLRHNGFVTTLSSVIIKSNRAHIFHVGDTRIYRFRQGALTLITRDHCHKPFNKGNFLTRALGIDSHLEIDYQELNIRCDDVFILTSDGVHQWVCELELTALLKAASTGLESTADKVLQHAMQKGSDDNLTCLLLKVTSLPLTGIDELNETGLKQIFPPALAVGHRIDHFKVLNILHSGSRSHVYLVEDNTNKQVFTLKAPSLNYSDDIYYLQAFIREQWVGERANSSGLMSIYPHKSRFLYHLCEYVEGETLRQWMYDHPKPSLQLVRKLLIEMVTSVRALQRLGVIHRDLKPENFMMNEAQKLVLIDYGAVQIDSLEDMELEAQEKIPLGALEYMSPEYLNKHIAKHQSDIFSMGVMIYEMLTQYLPYQHNLTSGINKIPKKDWRYISIQQYRPDIPLWIDLVIRKACHPDIEQRYQAMSEFIADLSTPNPALVDKHYFAALIEDDPLRLWRILTFILLLLLIIQSLHFMR
ncbi:bifunctional protein-serine/threonine kinase/phosphatase [Shewanella surugensis]|uniref:Bifunctional protein-serine/threonine kinase/phosphatase n=1 Tax=Shewanella surugensis TaxID=212020 RepID=A0ABT0LD33_9GAMM|nr:bifunctional protein-serine/threonine kinase/phosphatase [Shewanella surugensis]MCL1125076.1 bifunctional protein-serine/threonine kinase/phosphatase [Shewanella surugensis]